MQGMKGSFGIPEDMMEEIKRSKEKAAQAESKEDSSQEYYDSESIPEEEVDSPKEDPRKDKKESDRSDSTSFESIVSQQDKEEAEEAKMAKYIEETSKIDLTEDDLWDFITKGTLTKRDIPIFPGKLHASFRTLTLKDDREINESLGRVVDNKVLESGFKNINTRLILSRGLVELGPPGKLKPFGKDISDRETQLEEMSTILIERIAQRWNNFDFLIRHKTKMEMQEKKS